MITKLKIILLITVVALFSCKQKETLVENKATDERKMLEDSVFFKNQFNSLIEGKVINRYKAEDGFKPLFKENASFADVEVVKILRQGQNYHGQFKTGDTLSIFFNFTMEDTRPLFPNLNQHLPGIKKKEAFKAELNENDGGKPAYSIYLYQVID